jgi:hypothetical protein
MGKLCANKVKARREEVGKERRENWYKKREGVGYVSPLLPPTLV